MTNIDELVAQWATAAQQAKAAAKEATTLKKGVKVLEESILAAMEEQGIEKITCGAGSQLRVNKTLKVESAV